LHGPTLLRSAAKQFPSESSAVAQTERRHQPPPRYGSVAGGPRAQRGPYRGPRPRIQGLTVRDVAETAIDGAIEVGTDPSRDLRVPKRANQLLPREPSRDRNTQDHTEEDHCKRQLEPSPTRPRLRGRHDPKA